MIFGEFEFDLLGVAGFHADERVKDFRDKAPVLDLHPESGAFGDRLGRLIQRVDRLPVHEAVEIDADQVAARDHVLGGRLLKLGKGFAQPVDLLVDLLFRDGRLIERDRDFLVLRQIKLRLSINGHGKGDAGLGREKHVVDIEQRHHLDAGLFQCGLVEGAEEPSLDLFGDLFVERALDDLARRLAGTETGHASFAQEGFHDLAVFFAGLIRLGLHDHFDFTGTDILGIHFHAIKKPFASFASFATKKRLDSVTRLHSEFTQKNSAAQSGNRQVSGVPDDHAFLVNRTAGEPERGRPRPQQRFAQKSERSFIERRTAHLNRARPFTVRAGTPALPTLHSSKHALGPHAPCLRPITSHAVRHASLMLTRNSALLLVFFRRLTIISIASTDGTPLSARRRIQVRLNSSG